jgi:serine protease AprX
VKRWLTVLAIVGLLLPGLAQPPPAHAGGLLDKIDSRLLARMVDRTRPLPVIVEMAPLLGQSPLQRALQALALLRLNGQAVGTLAIVNGAAGWATPVGIEAISLVPGVVRIHEDTLVRPTAALAAGSAPGQLSARYPREVRADDAWAAGLTGRGVGVAVLDSGVAPDPDLVQSNRLVASVNFAGPRATADPGGHGTHVAGILAGDGTRSAGEFVGVAPQARVVDVRVLNGRGNGRVSSIIRGLQWVVAHKAQYNIRVANLSLGAPAARSYRLDLLAAAAEVAWRRGVVVVVAAGNGGPSSGTVQSPGIDPYVITVGASDDNQTVALADDSLGFFSSWGTPIDSTPKPDLVAPGRRVVSIRTPGSYLDGLYADRIVAARNGAQYFRLTGTSAATPMVAGAAALILQRQPGLRPDQVKAILTGTTQPYGGASALPNPSADGAGLLDVYAAATSAPRGDANQGISPAPTASGVLGALRSVTSLLGSVTSGDGVWDDGVWDDGVWDDGVWDRAGWDDGVWDAGRTD